MVAFGIVAVRGVSYVKSDIIAVRGVSYVKRNLASVLELTEATIWNNNYFDDTSFMFKQRKILYFLNNISQLLLTQLRSS